MSFKTKINYFNLSADGLVLTGTTENKQASTVEAKDEKGFIVANQVFGAKSNPTCDYTVTKNITLNNVVLGSVTTVDGNNYCLNSISFSTGAGSVPSVTASGQQVEATAAGVSNQVTLTAMTIQGTHHAQDFGAFEISGNGAHLTQSTLAIDCNITTATKDGDILAHDISEAKMTVNGTIQVSNAQYGVPTVTPQSGWIITSPLTESNPDSDYPTYAFTITKYLQAD